MDKSVPVGAPAAHAARHRSTQSRFHRQWCHRSHLQSHRQGFTDKCCNPICNPTDKVSQTRCHRRGVTDKVSQTRCHRQFKQSRCHRRGVTDPICNPICNPTDKVSQTVQSHLQSHLPLFALPQSHRTHRTIRLAPIELVLRIEKEKKQLALKARTLCACPRPCALKAPSVYVSVPKICARGALKNTTLPNALCAYG